ncbi:MAG: M28 family peptidase [Bacteroidota bacterium]
MDKGSKKEKLSYSFTAQGKTLKSEMVTAFVDRKSSKTILVGAHIDHLGLGGELSKSPGKNEVHPGADDNASGVAMLIELHNYFTEHNSTCNLLFVAYTGHELGLYGSEHLSKHWKKRWKNLYHVYNFDMIGRMDTLQPKLLYSSNFDVNLMNSSKSFLLTKESSQRCEILDTKHFLSVPCYTFTTGAHTDYHKISDLPDYLNYQGLCDQFQFYCDQLAQ